MSYTVPKRGSEEWAKQVMEIIDFIAHQAIYWQDPKKVIHDTIALWIFDQSYARDGICMAQKLLEERIPKDAKAKALFEAAQKYADGPLKEPGQEFWQAIKLFSDHIRQTYLT